jgi:hypothetical protein
VNSNQVKPLWIESRNLGDESGRQRSQWTSVLRNMLIFYVVWFNTTRTNCKVYLNYTCLVLHTAAFAHISREFAMPLETVLHILLAFHKCGSHNIPRALISGPLSWVFYNPGCIISCLSVCWGVNLQRVTESVLFIYTLLSYRTKNPVALMFGV